MDAVLGPKVANEEPETDEMELDPYRLTTLLWGPVQFVTVFGVLLYVSLSGHLGAGLFVGVGVIAGTIGINYSYEMMHQKPRVERWIANILLAMVLYSNFCRGHHRYIGTPRDPVTARYNESFFGSSQKSDAGGRCVATKSRIGRPVIRHKTRDHIEGKKPHNKGWGFANRRKHRR